MKSLSFTIASLGILGVSLSHAAPAFTVVDANTMDSLMAESRQEIQLAWRGGHPGGFRGPGPAHFGPSHVGPTHVGPTHIGPTYVAPSHYGHYYGPGPYYGGPGWVAPAVGGAVVGAAIANTANSANNTSTVVVVDDASSDAAKRRCASQYHSYDWNSGTYIAADGQVRSCP